MAGALTQYLQDKFIKHLFGVSYSAPGTIYIAAFTTPPTKAGGGTEATSYTRIAINSDMVFDGAGTGRYSNDAPVAFTDLPDATYVGIASYDASTAGNMLTFCQLTAPKTTTDGVLSFPIGNLVIGLG